MGLTAKYEDEDEYEDYEYDENGEDEDFEVEEGEESENFDKYKNLNNEKEDEDCEIPTGKITIEYMGRSDQEKKKSKMKGKRPPKMICNRGNQEDFTVDDLNALLKDNVFIAKSIEMIENTEKEKENKDSDTEGIPVYYPKQRLDITAVHGKIGHLPKTVGEENKRPEKGQFYNKEEKENDENTKPHGNTIVINSNAGQNKLDLISLDETKNEKKLRKKLLKEDKKEKRKQKKDLKTAYNNEKCKQMKQIACTNQVSRYGLSVKDI